MKGSEEFSLSMEERTKTEGNPSTPPLFGEEPWSLFCGNNDLNPSLSSGSLVVQMSKLKRDLTRQSLQLKFGHFEVDFSLTGARVAPVLSPVAAGSDSSLFDRFSKEE